MKVSTEDLGNLHEIRFFPSCWILQTIVSQESHIVLNASYNYDNRDVARRTT
jgi:hypothetical protein